MLNDGTLVGTAKERTSPLFIDIEFYNSYSRHEVSVAALDDGGYVLATTGGRSSYVDFDLFKIRVNPDDSVYTISIGEVNNNIALDFPLSELPPSTSDTITVKNLSNLPVGTVITDGANNFTASGGDTTVDITGWDLANISLTPVNNFVGEFTLTLAVTVSNGMGSDDTFTHDVNVSVTSNNVGAVSDTDSVNSNTVTEDARIGTYVGINAQAIDIDGDTVSYSLIAVNDNFVINSVTGVVTTQVTPLTVGFESITLRATSSDMSVSDMSFTVNVTNSIGAGDNTNGIGALADSDLAKVNRIAADATAGDYAGITAFADDIDAGDTVSYRLSNDAAGRFVIDNSTGAVTKGAATLGNVGESHNINVIATSTDGSTSDLGFTIIVEVNGFTPFTGMPSHSKSFRASPFDLMQGGTQTLVAGSGPSRAIAQRELLTVSIMENTTKIITMADLGYGNTTNFTAAESLVFTRVEGGGKLEVAEGNNWIDVPLNQPVMAAIVLAEGLRFVPDLDETGNNGFATSGVGNAMDDYAQIDFTRFDDQGGFAESRLVIDVLAFIDPNVFLERTQQKVSVLGQSVQSFAVGALKNGSYVHAFAAFSDTQSVSNGLYLQRYSAQGEPVADVTNIATTFNQETTIGRPLIKARNDGGFDVIYYVSASNGSVIVQGYDAYGILTEPNKVILTNLSFRGASESLGFAYFPGASAQGFVVAYIGSGNRLLLNIYDENNNLVSDINGLAVSENTQGNEREVKVEMLNNAGEFVVHWSDDSSVYVRSFDKNGIAQTKDHLTITTATSSTKSDLAILDNKADGGNIAVVATLEPQNGLYINVVNEALELVSSFKVPASKNASTDVSISAIAGGGAWLAWQDNIDGKLGIYSQRMDEHGALLGYPALKAKGVEHDVAALTGGGVVMAYSELILAEVVSLQSRIGADGYVYSYAKGRVNEVLNLSLPLVQAQDHSDRVTGIELRDLPIGLLITDGRFGFTATKGDTTVQITNWDLATMTMTLANAVKGEFKLRLVATITASDGTVASFETWVEVIVEGQ
jgi:hypothetical protein